MAFEVSIEADGRLDRAKFVETMEAYGTTLEYLGKYVRAHFPNLEASLVFHEIPPEPVTAKDSRHLDWQVCSVLTFRYAHGKSYESSQELNKVLRYLAANTDAFFVVSVDFGPATAIRDEAGLRFLPSWT